MIALAKFADRGPFVAAGLAAALLLSALWLPALMGAGNSPGLLFLASFAAMFCLIASAAVVAFVALRRGDMAGCRWVSGIAGAGVYHVVSVAHPRAAGCHGILVAGHIGGNRAGSDSQAGLLDFVHCLLWCGRCNRTDTDNWRQY